MLTLNASREIMKEMLIFNRLKKGGEWNIDVIDKSERKAFQQTKEKKRKRESFR
jgi:hypothetical protein